MKIWVAVLSILGGLAGIISGFLVTAFGAGFGEEEMTSSGANVFWISALAIFIGFLSWKFKKISGLLLIIIACYGFVANGLFFTIAFIFLLLAGILSFRIPTVKKEA
ncbi:hypothetical protein EI200_04510 [Peribacillus simplex]|uniref:hypothetical protein n=1 Tax=Peribacillus simplex TaxID=1478 RepID=UPI000F63B66C|nr:hypothetical protein [Peribacillus simplex]RRN73947.1 hypothetical protein EI200_04510 [Peribacillus simplex]